MVRAVVQVFICAGRLSVGHRFDGVRSGFFRVSRGGHLFLGVLCLI